MGLEKILWVLGSEVPFDKNGDLTTDGAKAWEKLIKVIGGLHDIGAISETSDQIESYCDEIVLLGF